MHQFILSEQTEADSEVGGGAMGGMAQPPPVALLPYLELERTTPEEEVEGEVVEGEVEVKVTGRVKCKRLGCGCVWCDKGCGMRLGLTLRDALKKELESFQSPYLVTLTVNQDRFDGPEDAVRWISSNGCISEFVRSLRVSGALLDRRYCSFMEFQENGWAHFHLIFDAAFVHFDVLCEAWAKAGWGGRAGVERWGVRPKFEGKGQKPVFGAVNFQLRGRESLGAMCHYLTKYVTKMPPGGWPDWLGRFNGQLRRWSTSRDFWRVTESPRSASKVTEFSKLRDKYFDPDEEWVEDDEFLRKIHKTRKTIAQRIEGCGGSSVVLEEVVVSSEEEGELARIKWRWVGMISAPVWDDPQEKSPTFRFLDEVDRSSFVLADPEGVALLRSLVGGAVEVVQGVDRKFTAPWSGLFS